ncbi:hypothetical protein PCA20602_03836 [Pandoraea capi]|uniref:Transposase n=1 Tax=Pandoraea capi TaxID=2508286 RepID=A0ABY6W739_9BURK|nr:hypothetical protein [Pandoraea capi]VVE34545.1 hypothetical protein PCA20602_03836 [Pandoraea capi]
MASDYGVVSEDGAYTVDARELDLVWLDEVYLVREYTEPVLIRVAMRFV